jgi:hypothetical protein
MCVRYGSEGYYQFDACSKCGFAYATNHEIEDKDEAVWEKILLAEGDLLVEKGLPRTREGYHSYIMSMPEPKEALKSGSVFFHKEFQKSTDSG